MRSAAARRPTRRGRAGLTGVATIALSGVLGLVLIACSDTDTRSSKATTTEGIEPLVVPDLSTGTTAPIGAGGVGETTAEPVRGRTPLAGFGEVQVTITSGDGDRCVVCLLSATTDEQRARGLMEVTDASLGGYDGMLFEFPDEVDGAFWMRNTPLALSVAYFDERGRLVSTADMTPCDDRSDCPSYPADRPFAFALEVLQGRLPAIDVVGEATLHVDARTCDPPGEDD